MPSKKKVQKALNEIIHEQTRPKTVRRDRAPTNQEKLQAMLQSKKGKQMLEDSPIYQVRDGKDKLIKPRTGSRRRVSVFFENNPLAKKDKTWKK